MSGTLNSFSVEKDQTHIGNGILTIVTGNACAFLQSDDIDAVRFDRRNCLIGIPTGFMVHISALFADTAAPGTQRKDIFGWVFFLYPFQQIPENAFVDFRGCTHALHVEGTGDTMHRLE